MSEKFSEISFSKRPIFQVVAGKSGGCSVARMNFSGQFGVPSLQFAHYLGQSQKRI